MTPRATPLRRAPLHIAALAIALSGLAGTAGREALAGALAVLAVLAARRLRRTLPGVTVALAALAVATVVAPLAGPAAVLAWAVAVALDERRREAAIADFSTPLAELLARPGFGLGRHERAVEVPWAIERVPPGARVLDVGFARAEPLSLDALLRTGARVFGLDLARRRVPGVHAACGDARRPPFRAGAFDVVLCISTIEHVGRGEARWVGSAAPAPAADPDAAMREAARALGALVAPGGRLLLTVPFGCAADHGWLAIIDRAGLDALERASGLRTVREDFFAYDAAAGWRRARAEELCDRDYGSHGAIAASAVACAELARDDWVPS